MSKLISIKLTKTSPTAGPFNIYDQSGNIIAENVSKNTLSRGHSYTTGDDVTMVEVRSIGKCSISRVMEVKDITRDDYEKIIPDELPTGCVWIHLRDPEIYNNFYGAIHPYIIEYTIAHPHNDEILQSVKDYTKTFVYTKDEYNVSNPANKIQPDDVYFNKAIVYNDQQCSGILELVPKPKNNLKEYMSYPITNSDSRTIIFTKSDNWYKFNNFFDVIKDKTLPIFTRTCVPLSYDKEIDVTNVEYTNRSYNKSPLRGKDVRIRLILDDRSDTKLISNILFTLTQNSYK
jgi:hypothetical protein